MKNLSCPLCRAGDLSIDETIKARDINAIYLEAYRVDVMYLFKEEEVHFCRCEKCHLKFFTPSVIGDEHFYNALQKIPLYYMEEKEEYDIASTYISASDNVLDVGCGKGAFAKKIRAKSFTGLELSTNAKDMAEQYGVKILNETIQEHALQNREKYNVVCTFQVLVHVACEIIQDFLQAMEVCLKKNGLLIISVPSDDSFVSKCVNNVLNTPPHHQTRWPDKTLKEIAGMFNLELVNIHHDQLAQRNSDEYLYLSINQLLKRKSPVINRNQGLIEKISPRVVDLLPRGLKRNVIRRIKPFGHSVTVVYRKK